MYFSCWTKYFLKDYSHRFLHWFWTFNLNFPEEPHTFKYRKTYCGESQLLGGVFPLVGNARGVAIAEKVREGPIGKSLPIIFPIELRSNVMTSQYLTIIVSVKSLVSFETSIQDLSGNDKKNIGSRGVYRSNLQLFTTYSDRQ